MSFGYPCFKVILCGDYGSGKSSLFRRFLDDSFTEESGPRSTVGLDHVTKTFDTVAGKVELELWDTCGIERFATLSSSYFQSAKAVILCYSLVDKQSFHGLVEHFFRTQVETNNSPALVFMCGTKCDLDSSSQNCGDLGYDPVTEENIKDFKFQCDETLTETYQVSSRVDCGATVHAMFADIARHLVINNQMNKYASFDENLLHVSKSSPEENKCCK